MGYKKEKASKISHINLISNPLINKILKQKQSKTTPQNLDFKKLDSIESKNLDITKIIIADSGYQEVDLENFSVCYFNAAILEMNIDSLYLLNKANVINPQDFQGLKNTKNYSLVIPLKNFCFENKDFITTFRECIFLFFQENDLLKTLKWLMFRRYEKAYTGLNNVRCFCGENHRLDYKQDSIKCKCCKEIFITDLCFRFDLLINEINGAKNVINLVAGILELLLLIDKMREIIESKNSIESILFIKDGPLSLFFGYKIDFVKNFIHPFLDFFKGKINFVGISKSGRFLEYLKFLASLNIIESNSFMLLDSNFITQNIVKYSKNFGEFSYFGKKVFMFHNSNNFYVFDCLLPFENPIDSADSIESSPIYSIQNLAYTKSIIQILDSIKCSFYPSSFLPVVLINKLTSISNTPSKKILTHFTKSYYH